MELSMFIPTFISCWFLSVYYQTTVLQHDMIKLYYKQDDFIRYKAEKMEGCIYATFSTV